MKTILVFPEAEKEDAVLAMNAWKLKFTIQQLSDAFRVMHKYENKETIRVEEAKAKLALSILQYAKISTTNRHWENFNDEYP